MFEKRKQNEGGKKRALTAQSQHKIAISVWIKNMATLFFPHFMWFELQ